MDLMELALYLNERGVDLPFVGNRVEVKPPPCGWKESLPVELAHKRYYVAVKLDEGLPLMR